MTNMSGSDDTSNIEFEAAAFRRLVEHLRDRPEVQNIDLMNLAGFCRNCLANWYKDAAAEKGVSLSKDEAREIVYGMPYASGRSASRRRRRRRRRPHSKRRPSIHSHAQDTHPQRK